jgi:hypothetical protein
MSFVDFMKFADRRMDKWKQIVKTVVMNGIQNLNIFEKMSTVLETSGRQKTYILVF